MIKKFSVENFRSFKDKISIDFSTSRDYDFNKELIKNGLINKALIYGPNSCGKSNLGFALMDITAHLTDNIGNQPFLHYKFPLNLESGKNEIFFEYVFCFNGVDIVYKYAKDHNLSLLHEEIIVQNKTVFFYDYINSTYSNEIDELKMINLENRSENISALKFIRNNAFSFSDNNPVKLIVDFANQMLWFRSLRINEFIGSNTLPEDISLFIIKNNYIADFNDFLNKHSVNDKVDVFQTNNGPILASVKGKRYAPFFDICSTGASSLALLYYWKKKRFKDVQFLFIDEFDAFYHTKISKLILTEINNISSIQSVLTTHNAYLADNSIMRPDCYFILKDGEIKNFSNRTIKTIREGNNISKMMLADEFD